MSEEATPKKKGSKLPIILVLLLLLGGGGFFMMKGKAAPKKVEVKAGEVASLDKEFLVNLASGPNTYLRAEISFELRAGFKKETLDANMPAIRDSINRILRSKTLQEVGASHAKDLCAEIATASNDILVKHMTPEEKKEQVEFEKLQPASAQNPASEKPAPKKDVEGPEDWVSSVGPVLNVYFTSFTTQ